MSPMMDQLPLSLYGEMDIGCFSEAQEDLDNGRCIKSTPVVAAGGSWSMAFYPNGKHPDTTDAMSVYLVLEDDDGAAAAKDDDIHYHVTFKFHLYEYSRKFNLHEAGGEKPPLFTYADFPGGVFGRRAEKELGFERFVTMWELNESGLWIDDCFIIACEFTIVSAWIASALPDHVVAAAPPEPSEAEALPLPSESSSDSELHDDLGHVLKKSVQAPPPASALPDHIVAAPLPEPSSVKVPSDSELSSDSESESELLGDVARLFEPTVQAPSPPKPSAVEVPPESSSESMLHLDLGRILETREGADVRFEVHGKVFPANKLVLAARSPVFRAQFYGQMEDTNSSSSSYIRISDMDPETFEALLHYIYTDSMPEIHDEGDAVLALDLLVAADRYNLKDLKSITEDEMCKYIDASRVFKMLEVAEGYRCQKLKKACLGFVGSRRNTTAIRVNEDVEDLARRCPSVVKELVAKILDAREQTPWDSLISIIDDDDFIISFSILTIVFVITFGLLRCVLF